MNTSILLAAMFSSLMALFAIVSILSSRISRPDLFFSITVNPNFRGSPEGQKILSQFTWSVIPSTALAVAVTWAGMNSKYFLVFAAFGFLISIGSLLTAFVMARSQTAPHRVMPSSHHEAEVRPRDTRLVGGWLGQVGPLLLLAAFAGYLVMRWNDIPERFPVHWGLNGEPNGWATRGPGVFSLLITGALTCLLLTGIAYLTVREGRRVNTSGPKGEQETKNFRLVQGILMMTNYWLAILFGGMSLLPLVIKTHPQPAGGLIAFSVGGNVVLIAVVIWLAAKAGQGGWRLRTSGATATGRVAVGDRTPDESWKGGLFYWNPDDPAMLVEKRFGYGWTLNFGNIWSWVVLGVILLFGVGVPLLGILLQKK